MLQQLFSRSLSVYPRLYLQFAALVGLLIAAEFSLSTLSMMLTQRAVYRVSQGVRRRREIQRRVRCMEPDGNCRA
ncbi:hypothetical protein RB25_19650 [Herbaspirillum rubrisubalbicans]|uniref:Uncharacterized protein n=1 Tax=Herbaspirillum rubrisubalbicans TaxID=80842 RepID=A0ABX9C113_9BURK|nr:hypothetical protein [Herbaspirillum rubrisubalbicans]NQE49759.1 hypothetical protein [Herbaspirillum rubrisubalbicans]RAM63783.1 hypothetical protein RB24_14925 [Herbaspirillum rubrisubalbicans]RAN44754.1 hypothetical protein RB25_19650 [Herbaspirillum rubrisubalbicans]